MHLRHEDQHGSKYKGKIGLSLHTRMHKHTVCYMHIFVCAHACVFVCACARASRRGETGKWHQFL